MDSIIHLDWESAKEVRKVAESSTYLHLDIFEINTGKLQGSERVIVAQLLEKTLFFRVWPKLCRTYNRSIYNRELSASNAAQNIYNTKKYSPNKYNTKIPHGGPEVLIGE